MDKYNKIKSAVSRLSEIGDDDYYFQYEGGFVAIYYNPDSNSGGQYVILYLTPDLIVKANDESSTVEEFYEYFDQNAYIELIDRYTTQFDAIGNIQPGEKLVCIGRTKETRDFLVNVSKDHANVDPESFRKAITFEKAKMLINHYCLEEFYSEADYSDLRQIGIGFTTVTDDEVPIQAFANLIDFQIERYLEDKLFEVRHYDSLEALIKHELEYLDFSDLTCATEEMVAFWCG